MRPRARDVALSQAAAHVGCTQAALEEKVHRLCRYCGHEAKHSVRYFDRPACGPDVLRCCNVCHLRALKLAEDTQYILEVWDRNARMTDQERREAYEVDQWDREVCRERH